MTASPCGTKKRMAANTHNVKELGPALAAVATHGTPITATRLKSTKSRKVRARSNCGAGSLIIRVVRCERSRYCSGARDAGCQPPQYLASSDVLLHHV